MNNEIENLKTEIASLKAARVNSARRIRELEKYVDTISSPIWKRIWFVIQGYRFRQLGRWYKAKWNHDAREWD